MGTSMLKVSAPHKTSQHRAIRLLNKPVLGGRSTGSADSVTLIHSKQVIPNLQAEEPSRHLHS